MGDSRKNVPVILQMEALECGAASLAMVLAFYKRYIPLEQLRLDCGVSRDGSNAKNILIAARHHGMKTKGYRYSIEKLKEMDNFPVIIHWNFNHFVVLTGFKKNKAYINDPASGKIAVDMDTFDKSYTGIVLTFEREPHFRPLGKQKSVGGFFKKHLNGYKGAVFAIVLMGFIISLISIANPVFTKIFMDYILLGKAAGWMKYLITAMIIVFILLFLLKLFQTSILVKAKGRMAMELGCNFLWHTLRLPVEFFSQRSPGDISGRQEDNKEITDILFDRLGTVVVDAIMVFIYFAILVFYSPVMAGIVFCITALNLVLARIIANKNENSSKGSMRDEGKMIGAAMAGISMIETIKASGAEEGYFGKISGYQAKYNNSINALNNKNIFLARVPLILTDLCNIVVLILSVNNILNGNFTIGLFLAFQGFLGAFIQPINKLVDSFEDIQKMSGKMDRIDDVMQYRTDVDNHLNSEEEITGSYEKLHGKVELKNITFGYSPLAAPFIESFNLVVQPGEMIALVGGSGSGKSTIASLITGLYKIRSGEILFDDKPRSDIDRYVFTNSVSVVDQSITIFKDTIRNNLTLWDDEIEEQILVEACKDACIYDDIMIRPEGFYYIMSEGGKNFSGGQRQRIEIARAFIANPSVIILDEATSALDPMTEANIMKAVKKRGITCIIIAHRLSTIRDADQIIMLDYGKEVERGTHAELIQIPNGRYANLVQNH